MTTDARAALAATFVLASSMAFAAPVTAEGRDIAVLRPGDGGDTTPWDGDRMHGARERLKDMLPGRRG